MTYTQYSLILLPSNEWLICSTWTIKVPDKKFSIAKSVLYENGISKIVDIYLKKKPLEYTIITYPKQELWLVSLCYGGEENIPFSCCKTNIKSQTPLQGKSKFVETVVPATKLNPTEKKEKGNYYV